MNSIDLHKKFHGRADKLLYETDVYEFTGILVDTKTYTLVSEEKTLTQRLKLNESTFGKGMGISNIRMMNGDVSQIDYISVSFGGMPLHRLSNLELVPNEDIFSYLKETIIPLVGIHNFEIYIIFKVPAKIDLVVDVMKITNIIEQEYIHLLLKNVLTYDRDYELNVQKGHNEIQLKCHSPTSKMIIVTNVDFFNSCSNVFLNLDDMKLPFGSYFKKVTDNTYECEFEPTINFSMIAKVFISFDYDKDDDDFDGKSLTCFSHKPDILIVSLIHKMYGFLLH